MRAALLALGVLLLSSLPATVPAPPADAVPASHGFFVPYMHLAALNIPEGIRPGGWVQVSGSDCTLSFVLRDTQGRLYITTAAHCANLGARASLTHDALVAAAATPEPFGTVVATWPGGLDAALIRIDPEDYPKVNPTLIGWGGPTGLATGTIPVGTETLHHGWGWVTWYEQQTRCRKGTLESGSGSTWWTEELGGGGDSGSAMMLADGRALGIVDWARDVEVVPGTGGAFYAMSLGGVRMDAVITRLNQQGWGLSLVTGEPVNPICMPEPPLP